MTNDQHSFVKFTRHFTPHLHLLRKGSVALVYLYLVLNQDEQGIVDADIDDIMACLQLGKSTIVSAFDNLEAASLIQPVQPRSPNGVQKGLVSYSLTGDFSRFGAGAPTGNGAKKVFSEGSEGPKKVFSAQKKVFSLSSSCSSSDSDSLSLEKREEQLQLQLPGAREEKTFSQSVPPEASEAVPGPAQVNAFALYEREGFGPLTHLVGDILGGWIDDVGEEAVVEALRQAVLRNKRSLAYVQGILKRQAADREVAQELFADYNTTDEAAPIEPVEQPEPIEFRDGGDNLRDARACWQTAYGELQLQMPRLTFDSWLRNSVLLGACQAEDGTVEFRLGLRSVQAREWVANRLDKVVCRILSQIAGLSATARYEVIPE